MAILLTTSYQQISTISLTYGEIRTYAKYSSQNNNITTYQLKSTYYISNYSNVSFDNATAQLDGTSKTYGYTTMYRGETTIQELERTITHNQDGSSPTKNIATSWTASFGGNGNTSVDIVFPKINRYPEMLTAPNFNDEENPTITYSNVLGFSGATVQAVISRTDGSLITGIDYRNVNVSDGSYTFNLTTTERNALRNLTPNSNTIDIQFKLRTTTTDNQVYISALNRQLTIINANPTFTNTEQETNPKVVAILGSSASSVVEKISIMRETIVPTALKGSTIASVRVVNGVNYAQTITTSPYVFDIPIETAPSIIKVTDSRGNISTRIVTKTLISYTPVSLVDFSFARENPTSSNIIVNFEGNYLQTNFGNTANVPTIKWKLDDGSYTTIPSTEYSIDTTNNKITISNYELTNVLDYRQKGTFSIELSDLLTSASDSQDVLKGIPTFDYGEHDLKVNGDLYIADEDGENAVNVLDRIQPKLLWENTNPQAVSTMTITLNSDDYDMLLVIVAHSYDSNMTYNSITVKGLDFRLIGATTTGTAIRLLEYVSDTEYFLNTIHGSSTGLTNGNMIPLYVIGYKTGLF